MQWKANGWTAATRRATSCAILLLEALVVCALGCNVLLDTSGYHVAPDAGSIDAAALEDATTETTSDSGGDAADASASACPVPTNRYAFENACTNAACAPFRGSVPMCDGSLCALPLPTQTDAASPADGAVDGSGTGSVDASADASSEGSTGDGAAGDSGDALAGDSGAVSAADSSAPVPCTTVASNPSDIIYVTGSTALASFIGEVSQVLATQPTNPVTVVYQQSGSCVGVRAMLDPTDNPLAQALGSFTYYSAAGTMQTCTLVASDDVYADIGASDVFYTTCYLGQSTPPPPLPGSVSENLGPVQVMNFAVPQGSTQQSISLTAAYYVFGFGGATPYSIAPWTDPTQLQIRSAASGTQSMIAAAIGVPPAQWLGVPHSTSSGVGAALVAAGQSADQSVIDSALGILASDYLLQNENTLRGLAVQDENAKCGFFPSSTSTAHDGANVRNGHYPLWGPSHFYTRVNQNQVPLKAGVSQFVNGVSGVTPLAGLDLVGEYAEKGLIPLCAMGVTRSSDGADYSSFQAPETCNCYFELKATGVTTCSMCSTNGDCPSAAPNCNKYGPDQQGYCDL
jgi:hypothetical protein